MLALGEYDKRYRQEPSDVTFCHITLAVVSQMIRRVFCCLMLSLIYYYDVNVELIRMW